MRHMVMVFVLAGLVGCGKLPESKPQSVAQKQITRAEFDELAKTLKTGNDFIAKFGKPSRTNPSRDDICFIFDHLTVDPITGKTDSSVLIYFKGNGPEGEYIRHTFSPGL